MAGLGTIFASGTAASSIARRTSSVMSIASSVILVRPLRRLVKHIAPARIESCNRQRPADFRWRIADETCRLRGHPDLRAVRSVVDLVMSLHPTQS